MAKLVRRMVKMVHPLPKGAEDHFQTLVKVLGADGYSMTGRVCGGSVQVFQFEKSEANRAERRGHESPASEASIPGRTRVLPNGWKVIKPTDPRLTTEGPPPEL